MAAEPSQTVGDLRRKAIVTDNEIAAATKAYLADPQGEPFRFGNGHKFNLAAAIEHHRTVKPALADAVMKTHSGR